jgi:hypothetical protein
MNDIDRRVTQLEATLNMGLRCMATLIEDLEMATNPDVPAYEREVARTRVRDLAKMVKESL